MVKFYTITIRIIQINGFRNTVIRHAGQRIIRFYQTFQDKSQILPGRVKNGGMEKTGGTLWCGWSIFTVPGVQANMMMIASGRNENGICSIPLHDLETEQILVEFQRPGNVRHLQMNVTDTSGGGNRVGIV